MVVAVSTPWENWQREKAKREGKEELKEDNTYKKLGEYCSHPKEKRALGGGLPEEGGKYIVCLLCGRILNDT